jgi:hypothetical protein
MFYSGGNIKSIVEGIINKCLNALGIVVDFVNTIFINLHNKNYLGYHS